ncbi:MAG: hypothetical protein NDJ19_01005 [Ramlibacter sp.]|nr:hypothetical protein [Ramlibacter sp.]
MESQFSSASNSAAPTTPRRELLRVAIRSTLNRHGIPIHWLGAEVVSAKVSGREPGLHLRLLIRHWDPRLPAHAVALQNSLIERIMSFDPLASNWLTGISWQFDLADESLCPALPPADTWASRATPVSPAPVRAQEGAASVQPARATSRPAARQAPDSDYPPDVKEDLARLLAVRDAEMQRNAQRVAGASAEPGPPTYSRTQPMPLQ